MPKVWLTLPNRQSDLVNGERIWRWAEHPLPEVVSQSWGDTFQRPALERQHCKPSRPVQSWPWQAPPVKSRTWFLRNRGLCAKATDWVMDRESLQSPQLPLHEVPKAMILTQAVEKCGGSSPLPGTPCRWCSPETALSAINAFPLQS